MEFTPDIIMAIVCFVGFIAMFFLGQYLQKRKINDSGISKEFEVIFYNKMIGKLKEVLADLQDDKKLNGSAKKVSKK